MPQWHRHFSDTLSRFAFFPWPTRLTTPPSLFPQAKSEFKANQPRNKTVVVAGATGKLARAAAGDGGAPGITQQITVFLESSY